MLRSDPNRRPLGLPEIDADLRLDGCVRAVVVHDGGVVQIVHWRCLRDGDALRAERTHTHYVVSLLHAGACSIAQGRWTATLDAATAVLHRPGSTYRTLHPFGCCDAGWSLAFDRETAEDLIGRCGARPWSCDATAISTAPARDMLAPLVLLQRLRRRLPVDDLAVEELSLELLARLLPGADRPEPTPSRRLAERATAYLHERAGGPLRLADVARASGCSPYHLCRVFKAQKGVTIGAYARRLRLASVLDALATEKATLAEIALARGFDSHSHLTSGFSREFAVPPRRVRAVLRDPSRQDVEALRGLRR